MKNTIRIGIDQVSYMIHKLATIMMQVYNVFE